MKRFAYFMAAALILMSTLAGCSNNKTGGTGTGNGTTGTPTSYSGTTMNGTGTTNGNIGAGTGYTGATNGTSRSNGGNVTNNSMGYYGTGTNGVNNVTADM